MKPWRNTHRVSSVALTNENLLRRASRTDFGEAGGRCLRGDRAGSYPLQTHLKTDRTTDTPQCAVLGYAMPASWLGRLSVGKKLSISFGLILILLTGNLSASFLSLPCEQLCRAPSADHHSRRPHGVVNAPQPLRHTDPHCTTPSIIKALQSRPSSRRSSRKLSTEHSPHWTPIKPHTPPARILFCTACRNSTDGATWPIRKTRRSSPLPME